MPTTPCEQKDIMTNENTGIAFTVSYNDQSLSPAEKGKISSPNDGTSMPVVPDTPLEITGLDNIKVTTVTISGTNIDKIYVIYNGDDAHPVSNKIKHFVVWSFLEKNTFKVSK